MSVARLLLAPVFWVVAFGAGNSLRVKCYLVRGASTLADDSAKTCAIFGLREYSRDFVFVLCQAYADCRGTRFLTLGGGDSEALPKVLRWSAKHGWNRGTHTLYPIRLTYFGCAGERVNRKDGETEQQVLHW
jgi:hypothetical protein